MEDHTQETYHLGGGKLTEDHMGILKSLPMPAQLWKCKRVSESSLLLLLFAVDGETPPVNCAAVTALLLLLLLTGGGAASKAKACQSQPKSFHSMHLLFMEYARRSSKSRHLSCPFKVGPSQETCPSFAPDTFCLQFERLNPPSQGL